MTNRWQRLWMEIRENRKRRKENPSLDVTAEGFVLTRRKKPAAIAWSEVTEIAAGTHAMITGELFYAVISGGGHVLEINEFVDGFNALEAAVSERWPSLRARWLALQTAPGAREICETLWMSGDAR